MKVGKSISSDHSMNKALKSESQWADSVKSIYSEKADTTSCEIYTVYLSYGRDFTKFCGLLRIHEL